MVSRALTKSAKTAAQLFSATAFELKTSAETFIKNYIRDAPKKAAPSRAYFALPRRFLSMLFAGAPLNLRPPRGYETPDRASQ